MTAWQKTLSVLLGLGIVLGYSGFVSRNDPDLKDGIRCLVEQMAEHRVGDKQAHEAQQGALGVKVDPNELPGWKPSPTPTGEALCDKFLKEDN